MLSATTHTFDALHELDLKPEAILSPMEWPLPPMRPALSGIEIGGWMECMRHIFLQCPSTN